MTFKKYSTAIFAALLAGLVLTVYWQTTGFEFINLDDPEYTVRNPFVNGGLSIEGIHAAFTQFWGRYWIPVTWLSYMADVSVSGLSPEGFHRTNVILHGLNVLLLFFVLRNATGSTVRSFFVAALWAIHPLRAESVAWVAERKDVLSGFFFLLALLGHIEYARTGKKLWLAAITVFALFGLMAKPVVMVLPVALLLMDFWPLGRFPEGRLKENLPGYGKLLFEKAHLFALSAVFVLITLKSQKIDDALNSGLTNTAGAYVNFAAAVKAYCAYIFGTFWPVGLYLRGKEYELTFGVPLTILCFAVLVLVSFLAFKHRKRFPELAFGWFWYLLILFPNSGIVRAGISTFSDRFTYLPHIGIMVAAVWGVERLYSRFAKDLRPLATAGAGIIAILSILCFRQVSIWKNDISLFTHADRVTGGKSAMAKEVLGVAWFLVGRYQESYDSFTVALELDPGFAGGYGYKGLAAARLGRYAEASELCRKELQLNPGNKEITTRLAYILIRAGDLPGGARLGLENIRRWPDDKVAWEAVNYLGGEAKARALAQSGNSGAGP
ncbi:hypothetical protein EPN96_05900 [bacterium]|nr:MAG: hypothetical protein EPN96_05900 [bacterium]